MEEIEKAYIAGILDGEGYIGLADKKGVTRGKKYHYIMPYIHISNTNKDLIDHIKSTVIFGYIGRRVQSGSNHKIIWFWASNCLKDVWGLLADVLPCLIVKKEQAQLLIEFCEKHNPRAFTDNVSFSEILAYCSLRHLNKRGLRSPCEKCPFEDNCEVI